MEILRTSKRLREIEWPDDAFFYPKTDFEELWIGEGRVIQRARFVWDSE